MLARWLCTAYSDLAIPTAENLKRRGRRNWGLKRGRVVAEGKKGGLKRTMVFAKIGEEVVVFYDWSRIIKS